jgi:hypothetical protein
MKFLHAHDEVLLVGREFKPVFGIRSRFSTFPHGPSKQEDKRRSNREFTRMEPSSSGASGFAKVMSKNPAFRPLFAFKWRWCFPRCPSVRVGSNSRLCSSLSFGAYFLNHQANPASQSHDSGRGHQAKSRPQLFSGSDPGREPSP